jgi:hypothetical protein
MKHQGQTMSETMSIVTLESVSTAGSFLARRAGVRRALSHSLNSSPWGPVVAPAGTVASSWRGHGIDCRDAAGGAGEADLRDAPQVQPEQSDQRSDLPLTRNYTADRGRGIGHGHRGGRGALKKAPGADDPDHTRRALTGIAAEDPQNRVAASVAVRFQKARVSSYSHAPCWGCHMTPRPAQPLVARAFSLKHLEKPVAPRAGLEPAT